MGETAGAYAGGVSVLYLVRHGRTDFNERGLTQGSSDSPLTAQGRRGAEATRDYLAEVPFSRAYLSPQGRVRQTADIILPVHPSARVSVLRGLREYDFGVYEGGPDEELAGAIDPILHATQVMSGLHPGLPGGISAADYLAQVDAAIARIIVDCRVSGRVDEDILVVSHGVTLSVLCARWLGAGILSREPMANSSVTTIEFDPTIASGDPRLLAWAVDPGEQSRTLVLQDMSAALSAAFKGVRVAPIDWDHPEPVGHDYGPAAPGA